ncbi:MAG: protein kinase, partial [Planctomycetota bacterium]
MDPARWKKIEAIYHAILQKPSEEREAFLDSVCGNDEELKKELLSLLDASMDMQGFMSHPPLEDKLRLDTATSLIEKEDLSLTGTFIGPYRLEKRIASGGMGTVYLAVRTDKSFEQKVAIKLIRGGLQNRNIIRCFYRERQTLANLNHPNIARLFYGDTTDDGNP